MRYMIAVVILLALVAVAAHAATHTYVVRFSADGVTWQNAPQQYIFGPYPTWPTVPQYRLYLSRRDANVDRNTGQMNHPDVYWRVLEL